MLTLLIIFLQNGDAPGVKKAEGRRQKAEGLQYSVGFKPTLIASGTS